MVDENGRVVKLNERAQSLFETSNDQLPRSASSLVGTELASLRADGEVSLGARTYGVSYTQLDTADDANVGGIVVLYDITTERNQRQKLSVLNRVLRHNLRNEMAIIRGHANSVRSDETDRHLSEQMRTIVDSSNRLLSISEQMTTLKQTVEGDIRRQALDCRGLLKDIRTELSETYPESRVTVVTESAPESVSTDPAVLSLAVRTLAENAIHHSNDPVPTVELSCAGSDDETVVFGVRDTNDQIPRTELAALSADEEEPLQHGRSIGLWLVKWSVTAIGGELSFRYDGGNVATIALPVDPRAD